MTETSNVPNEIGKFGKATIVISTVASATLLIVLAVSILFLARHGTPTAKYIAGVTMMLCWLFEFAAIVLGVVALFEKSQKKAAVIVSIVVAAICFVGTLSATLAGMHSHNSVQQQSNS